MLLPADPTSNLFIVNFLFGPFNDPVCVPDSLETSTSSLPKDKVNTTVLSIQSSQSTLNSR